MSWMEQSCKCPYYLYDNGKKVGCDRFVLHMHDKKLRSRYVHTYCCKNYKKCSIAKTLEESYNYEKND